MKKTTKATACLSIALLSGIALSGCDTRQTERDSSPTTAGQPANAAALFEALESPDPYARARDLGALLPRLSPDALPAIKDALADHRLDLGAAEVELLTRFWASLEPAEATTWSFKKAPPLSQLAAVRTAVEGWAAAEPRAAAAAVGTAMAESNEQVARIAELALVRGWFETDRPGLERYIYDLGSGIKRQRAIFAYVLALAASEGSDAAMGWAESIPEDDVRYKSEVYRQLIAALSWADMPSAMRFCDAHCDGPFGTALRNVLVRTQLRQGDFGGDVVDWVARTAETSEQQRANKRQSLWVAYATWASRDRETAIEWLRQRLPDVPTAEAEQWLRWLYPEYARQIGLESPEEAIRWAEAAENEKQRELVLVRIVREWRKRDEQAAEAWLAQSDLSEFARKQALDVTIESYLPGSPEIP